jgi:transposase
MNGNEILTLGLGLQAPWKITGQLLDTKKTPHELLLTVGAKRGAKYPCPVCGQMCSAHDFKEMTWRHLNFFQHHCYITASVPRVRCPEHGVKRVKVPWARKGSRFTLLFEQFAMTLVKEMPVLAAARIIGIKDKRLWRIVKYYVGQALAELILKDVKAFGLDETASKRGHNYVTVFMDLDRREKPIIFATPGKGKRTVSEFRRFLKDHDGQPENILEVVCDMSPSFLAAVQENFENAEVTVDWFHVVQLFTRALDEVRRKEAADRKLPKGTRWATLKNADGPLTEKQIAALAELEEYGFLTAKAWRAKEMLRWVRKAKTARGARWRLTHFIRYLLSTLDKNPIMDPVFEALETVMRHKERILARWHSGHCNARLEGLNSLFQAARARARGYRNTQTFITMIYLIAAPIGNIVNST